MEIEIEVKTTDKLTFHLVLHVVDVCDLDFLVLGLESLRRRLHSRDRGLCILHRRDGESCLVYIKLLVC